MSLFSRIIITAIFLIIPLGIYADTYTTLAPITTQSADFVSETVALNEEGLTKYLNDMYRFGIALCGALAVLMILFGAIQRMSSDSWSKQEEGLKKINAAVLGLLVVLGSYALLKTVNPALLSTELGIQQVNVEGIDTPRPSTGTGTDRDLQPVEPIDGGNTLPGAVFPNDQFRQLTLDNVTQAGLSGLKPSDAAKYLPNGGTDEDWVNLFASIAKKESNFNPNLTYTENFRDSAGNLVISTGLLQISQESARGYGFPNITKEQLKDPATNLQVGVAIMKRWVERDGCISCKNSAGEWRGGARYWAVLRK